jgi:hypothetical protein
VPDHTREDFREEVSRGGHDGGGRSLRYLSWSEDPDPRDGLYRVHYAFLLRDRRGRVRAVAETHDLGLHPRSLWVAALREAGLRPRVLPFRHSSFGPGVRRVMFVGVKPAAR